MPTWENDAMRVPSRDLKGLWRNKVALFEPKYAQAVYPRRPRPRCGAIVRPKADAGFGEGVFDAA